MTPENAQPPEAQHENKLENGKLSDASACSDYVNKGSIYQSECKHGHHVNAGCLGRGLEIPNCLRDDRIIKNGIVTAVKWRG